MKGRDKLIHLFIKYGGDWELIYKALSNKESIDKDDSYVKKQLESMSHLTFITLLDDNYPQRLKQVFHPPFVIVCKGEVSILNKEGIGIIGDYNKENILNDIDVPVVQMSKDLSRIEISSNTSYLYITISMGKKEINKKYLTNTFSGLYNKLVISRKGLPSDDILYKVVAESLNINTDIYVQPTTHPSVNNKLIKNGAYLFDTIEDLQD